MNIAPLNGATVNGAAQPYVPPNDLFAAPDFRTSPTFRVSSSAEIYLPADTDADNQVYADSASMVLEKSVFAVQAASFGSNAQADSVYALSDRLMMSAAARGPATMTVRAISALRLADAVILIRVAAALDQMTFSDTALGLYERLAAAIDMLRTKDSALSRYELIARAAAVLALQDGVASLTAAEALDSLTATDEAATKLVMLAAAAESLLLAESVLAGSVALLFAGDQFTSADVALGQATLTARAASTLLIGAELHLLGEIYDAWAVNTETGAASNYTNYSFDSMFTMSGKTYGTSEAGLMRLDGDTDAGEPIFSRIVSGELDFGTNAIKRMEQAWVAYTGSGDMVLKVTVNNYGKREQHWYRSKSAGAYRTEAKMNIGRGLESHYWQFELVNAGGKDFELDN